MPRACTICPHPERAAIDGALVGSAPMRQLAALYRVSEDALARHKAAHLPQTLAKAQAASEIASADELLAEVNRLRLKAYALLQKAERAGDYRTAIAGVREARGCLELLGKLMGELNEGERIGLLLNANPQYVQVRAALMAVLEPHPDIRTAVAGALLQLEAPGGHSD